MRSINGERFTLDTNILVYSVDGEAGRRHQIASQVVESHVSYWDALLIAAAAEAGCTAIVTEDMSDGELLKGVRVVHPFASGDELPDQVRSLLGMDQAL